MNTTDNRTRKIAIACQGGGAHTAFTAGVLKKLLAEKKNHDYEIVALSGTSGGAICAYLAWYSLLGDKEKAIDEASRLLDEFWTKDNVTRFPWPWVIWKESLDQLQTLRNTGNITPGPGEAYGANEFVKSMNRWFESLGLTAPAMSPYNPLVESFRFFPVLHNPDYWQDQLKTTIANRVNDKMIEERGTNRDSGPMLYIGAANPRTGEFQVFRSHTYDENQGFVFNHSPNDRISVEAVLASTAIPFLFEAVCTGKAVYWHGLKQKDGLSEVQDAVYWDGLYSSNPPIRELAELNPDEIWVIQINPEEIDHNPTDVQDLQDRRNELAGNLSLNQELYFVRRTNELVRRFGEYKDGEIKLGDDSGPNKKEYRVIKVRRIELTRPLDYLSKLGRDEASIKRLMNEDSEHETEPFLKALSDLSPFEEAWEKALQEWKKATQDRGEDQDQGEETEEQKKVLDDVMNLFTDQAKIKLVPPKDSSASEQGYEGKDLIREHVRWCLEGNFTLEQTRYYRVDGKKIRWWMLASAGHFGFPVKGLAKVELSDDNKIESFAFYPMDMKMVEKLAKA